MNYTREEVVKLCKAAWQVGFNVGQFDETQPTNQSSDDWIVDNL